MVSTVTKIDQNDDEFAEELKPGTELLHGQYVIEEFLNSGGFGITYLAKDSLDRRVVIKECYPGSLCRRSQARVGARSRAHQAEFKSVIERFVQEAKSLAKLKHPNIVGVHQVFEDNDTAYMALDYIEGFDLLETLEDGGERLNPEDITKILRKILGAVDYIHSRNILHRDISPDNILVNKKNSEPLLIDFGAAREEVSRTSRVLSALRVVKDGYSPQEFYVNGSVQGPPSDLYALSASFYHLITGDMPPDSQTRLAALASDEDDPYVPLTGRIKGYDEAFLVALDKAINVLPKNRIQSAKEWLEMISGGVSELPTATKTKKPAASTSAAAGAGGTTKSGSKALLVTTAIVLVTAGGGFAVWKGMEPAPTDVIINTPAELGGNKVETPATDIVPVVEDTTVTPTDVTDEVVVEDTTVAPTDVTDEVVVEDTTVTPTDVTDEVVVEDTTVAPTDVTDEVVVEDTTVTPADVTDEVVVEDTTVTPTDVTDEVVVEDTTVTPADVTDEVVVEDTTVAPADVTGEVVVEDTTVTPADVTGEVVVEDTTVTPADVTGEVVVEDTTVAPTDVTDEVVVEDTTVTPADVTDEVVVEDTTVTPTDVTDEVAVEDTTVAPVLEFATGSLAELPTTEDTAVVEQASIAPVLITDPVLEDVGAFGIKAVPSAFLPFTEGVAQPGVIVTLNDKAPSWMETGQKIVGVNGHAINSFADINPILRSLEDMGDLDTVQANFLVEGSTEWQTADLEVFPGLLLAGGLEFQIRAIGGDDTVRPVAITSQVSENSIKAGDILVTYLDTGEKIGVDISLEELLLREASRRVMKLNFIIDRGGKKWIAPIHLTGQK